MAAILAVVAVVVLSGVKASAKFAEYIAAAELATLTAVSYFLRRSGFKLYNLLADGLTRGVLYGVLFGLGDPGIRRRGAAGQGGAGLQEDRRSHVGGRALLVALSLLLGVMAAFMVNDAVALVGPPAVYALSRAAGLDFEGGILLLAFALTVGGVMAPLGNPQNVLMAVESGMRAPFITFLEALATPTLINLLILPSLIARWYDVPARRALAEFQEAIGSRRDAVLAGSALPAAVAALLANDVLEILGIPHIGNMGSTPFLAAAVYVFAEKPREVLGGVSWGTIIFFITMFIAMWGIRNSGVPAPAVSALLPAREGPSPGISAIAAASLAFSQVLSNLPFTEFFIEYVKAAGYGPSPAWPWLALAMSSPSPVI